MRAVPRENLLIEPVPRYSAPTMALAKPDQHDPELMQPLRATARTSRVVGRHVGLDASRNIVYTDGPDDVVITLGVHDLVIVKRGNAVMLVHKDRVQEIKTLLADERMAELLEEVGV